ncbi:MAG: hypothetical protein M9927_15490 [Anaerolineae bacterium]|nr:hypothetical protein [Anaerolineae bacterium]
MGDNFAIHEGDPVEAIARALADEATLVVFDNVESILPNGDVPLPADALQALLHAAAQWFPPLPVNRSPIHHSPINHSSRLLLTTRDPNLPHPAFQPGRGARRMELPGLDTADALEFAGPARPRACCAQAAAGGFEAALWTSWAARSPSSWCCRPATCPTWTS